MTLFYQFLILVTDDTVRYGKTCGEFVSHEFFISWCTLGQDIYTNLNTVVLNEATQRNVNSVWQLAMQVMQWSQQLPAAQQDQQQ